MFLLPNVLLSLNLIIRAHNLAVPVRPNVTPSYQLWQHVSWTMSPTTTAKRWGQNLIPARFASARTAGRVRPTTRTSATLWTAHLESNPLLKWSGVASPSTRKVFAARLTGLVPYLTCHTTLWHLTMKRSQSSRLLEGEWSFAHLVTQFYYNSLSVLHLCHQFLQYFIL